MFIIYYDVEFIKHAAFAIGALQLRLFFVMTLNLLSMLLLPWGICGYVCYLSRH